MAVAAAGGKAGPGAGADFEFLLGGCAAASMLPADELFSGGKLVPLRIPAPPAEEEAAAGAAVALSTALPPKQAQAPVSASVAAQQPEEAKGVAVVGGDVGVGQRQKAREAMAARLRRCRPTAAGGERTEEEGGRVSEQGRRARRMARGGRRPSPRAGR